MSDQWQPGNQSRRPAVPPQFQQSAHPQPSYQQPQPPPQFRPAAQVARYGPSQQAGWQPQPQYAPQVAPKSTATGLLLGLLIPGTGCMYAGRTAIGILILALWLVSIPLAFVFFIGVVTGFILWVVSAVLGYTMARDWNAARGIAS